MSQANLKFDPLLRYFVGFDHLQRQIKEATSQNYPPFNIEQIKGEGEEGNQVLITLAVAGFKKEELELEQHDQKLIITGKKAEDEARTFVHKGISTRSFRQTFQLHEFLEIKSINLDSGLLSISLSEVIPEEKKPKRLEIS